jgi:hypothetical protein
MRQWEKLELKRKSSNGGISEQLENLDFGNNVCLLTRAFLNVEKKLLDLESKGLTGDCEKTKSLRINAKIDQRFKVSENDIEEVNKFSYVGSVVNSPAGVE